MSASTARSIWRSCFSRRPRRPGSISNSTRGRATGTGGGGGGKGPFSPSFWGTRPAGGPRFPWGIGRGSSINDTKWSPDHFQQLLLAARGELDTNKRRAMYHEMQQILWEDGGQIVPVWVNHIAATNPKIATPAKISGANEMDGHRCAE